MTQSPTSSEKLLIVNQPLSPILQTRPRLGNNRVNEHPDFNQDSQYDMPLLYLELLRVANARNLKPVFGQGREACQQMLHVSIPELPLFLPERRGLEGYPSLLAHITRLWPSTISRICCIPS